MPVPSRCHVQVVLDQLTFGPAYNLAFMAYTSMVVHSECDYHAPDAPNSAVTTCNWRCPPPLRSAFLGLSSQDRVQQSWRQLRLNSGDIVQE